MISRIKVQLIDRLGIQRTAYLYFTKDENYSKENVDSFVAANEVVLFGAKPISIDEDVVFDTFEEASDHVDGVTGTAWDPSRSPLHIWPPLTIGPAENEGEYTPR